MAAIEETTAAPPSSPPKSCPRCRGGRSFCWPASREQEVEEVEEEMEEDEEEE